MSQPKRQKPNEGPRLIAPSLPSRDMERLSAFIEHYLESRPDELVVGLRRLHEEWKGHAWIRRISATALVVADLVEQGWKALPSGPKLYLSPPGLKTQGETVDDAKARLRRALQAGSQRQLADASVRRFLTRLSATNTNGGMRSSALLVVDRGPDLAAALREKIGADAISPDALRDVVDPEIEVCDDTARCTETGIRLLDLWRYFRHTWSLEYRSIPGRQLPILIRNRARPGRPVMGIALLASPILRTRTRDAWIGWLPDVFVERVASGAWDAGEALHLLRSRVQASLLDIRWDDLIPAGELDHPTERTILRLVQRGAGAQAMRVRELEERFADVEGGASRSASPGRGDAASAVDWRRASEDALFVRKRSETLADLLSAKQVFDALNWSAAPHDVWAELNRHPSGARAISIALVEVRKAGLASQIADLSVCGAVPPYNTLLGGKLVAMLMTSAEVRKAWSTRYAGQPSIISSQMAGRPIARPADLRMLTTTSLYGVASSQYNRLVLRAASHPDLGRDIVWERLEQTTGGYGTAHLAPDTVRALRDLAEERYQARRINHRFGEGTSPRLRQVREGLEVLGIRSDDVLHHATPRLFYACELHDRAREALVGFQSREEGGSPSLAAVASAWRQRWLASRICNPEILTQVTQFLPEQLALSLIGSQDQDQLQLPIG